MMESVIERCKMQIHKFKKIYDFESAYWFAEKWLSAVFIDSEKSSVGAKQRNYFDGKWINLPNNDIHSSLLEPLEEMISCLIHNQQFARAVHFIKSNGLHIRSKTFFLLLLHCQVKLKDWINAELTLMDYEDRIVGKADLTNLTESEDPQQARIAHLKGVVFDALEKRELAVEEFKFSVKSDVSAVSSMMTLANRTMMDEKEAQIFIDEIFSGQEEDEMKRIYEMNLTPTEFNLKTNSKESMLLNAASIENYIWEVKDHMSKFSNEIALRLSSKLMKIDPYDDRILLNHIGLLVESDQSNELYKLGHLLIGLDPDKWIGWYCAGCYYLVVKKFMKAIDMLRKALIKNPNFGHAYLALGHVFSEEKEYDQAMNSYLSAQRVMPGSALPDLYVSVSYRALGNYEDAHSFIKQAYEREPCNPMVLHEYGTNLIKLEDYENAAKFLNRALNSFMQNVRRNSQSEVSPRWAPLLFNLGTALRLKGDYKEAVEMHKRGLILSSSSADGHIILATSLFADNLFESVEQLQNAMTYDRQNSFTNEILTRVINELSKEDHSLLFDDSSDEEKEEEPLKPLPTQQEVQQFVTPQNRPRLQSTPREFQFNVNDSFEMSIDEDSTMGYGEQLDNSGDISDDTLPLDADS